MALRHPAALRGPLGVGGAGPARRRPRRVGFLSRHLRAPMPCRAAVAGAHAACRAPLRGALRNGPRPRRAMCGVRGGGTGPCYVQSLRQLTRESSRRPPTGLTVGVSNSLSRVRCPNYELKQSYLTASTPDPQRPRRPSPHPPTAPCPTMGHTQASLCDRPHVLRLPCPPPSLPNAEVRRRGGGSRTRRGPLPPPPPHLSVSASTGPLPNLLDRQSKDPTS